MAKVKQDNIYTADFETTTDINDCRVWLWGVYNIYTEKMQIGTEIETFINFCADSKVNSKIYFHNLKFDGSFICDWLLRNGFHYIMLNEKPQEKSFTTMISDTGLFYSIKIYFGVKGRKVNKVEIYDSLKLFTMSVKDIAKSFHMEDQKGEIDYNKNRPIGYIPDSEEIEYLRKDLAIVANALRFLFDQGMTAITTAGNALKYYKSLVGEKRFQYWFPEPEYDHDVRQSYRGGFTYAAPQYKNKVIGKGIVLDVNSLYPYVMYSKKLPFGEPIFFEGKYKQDNLYCLYIQMFTCQFKIKEKHIPTIQLKHSRFFASTEYVLDSGSEEVTLFLTNVDLELFFDHYDAYNITWINGYKFKGATGFFKDYINYWSDKKIQAKKEENHGIYLLSKFMLNSLYGKFASNPVGYSKIPIINDKGVLQFVIPTDEKGEKIKENRKPIYIPMASFITAYAREKTIRAAQTVYDRFLYADTDSLHLIGEELPEGLEVDDTLLGAWKHESTFVRGKYIRAKSYVEETIIKKEKYYELLEDCETPKNLIYKSSNEYVKLNITCAGMPEGCYENVTFDNFKPGAKYPGKMKPELVPGGTVLLDIDFTIRTV